MIQFQINIAGVIDETKPRNRKKLEAMQREALEQGFECSYSHAYIKPQPEEPSVAPKEEPRMPLSMDVSEVAAFMTAHFNSGKSAVEYLQRLSGTGQPKNQSTLSNWKRFGRATSTYRSLLARAYYQLSGREVIVHNLPKPE